jgi:hypothetical protein
VNPFSRRAVERLLAILEAQDAADQRTDEATSATIRKGDRAA